MSGRKLWLRALLVIVLVLPTSAHGQSAPVQLTLRDAVLLALRQNPSVLIAEIRLVESRQDASISRAALLPQASLQVSDSAERLNVGTTFGTFIPGFPHHSGPFQVFAAGPSFSMPLLDLTLLRNWQAAKQTAHATGSDALTIREQTAALVVSQYLAALRARAEVRAVQSRVNLAITLYNQAVSLEKNGSGTNLDTVRAQVELQNERQNLLVADTQLQTTLNGLVQLLHVDPRQTIELGDEMSFFETPAINVNESLECAYAARPEMQSIASQQAALELEKSSASASRLPTLSVGGQWQYEGNSAPTAIPTYVYQALIEVPILTGGRIKAQIARANLELKRIEEQKAQLRDQIALEVNNALAALDSARNQVDVAKQGLELAQREVAQSRERFEEGVANNIEVVTAQDNLARAHDNLIEALYRYNQAGADLARATGRMEDIYGK
jgi:outer membrane protein